jgi:hypothetical protein
MKIDCGTCAIRGQGCDDCVVTAIFEAPPVDAPASDDAGLGGAELRTARLGEIQLDAADLRALRVLADSGLVTPLVDQAIVRYMPLPDAARACS